jgi:hypothetical protein
MKDIKKNSDKEESVFVSGKAGIIVHSFFLIFVVLAPFIFLPSLFKEWFLVLLWVCSIWLVSDVLISSLLYEEFFVINYDGFSYGKRQRYGAKKIMKQTDYKWAQIKELFFKDEGAPHARSYLVIVRNPIGKRNIGHRYIYLSDLPIGIFELMELAAKYSKRNDIFRESR